MKTLITISTNKEDAFFDPRFGRASWFCVFDESTHAIEFHANPYKHSEHDAGTNAASLAVELSVKRVISGHFGSKANHMLDKNGIQMVLLPSTETTLQHIIKQLKAKKASKNP